MIKRYADDSVDDLGGCIAAGTASERGFPRNRPWDNRSCAGEHVVEQLRCGIARDGSLISTTAPESSI